MYKYEVTLRETIYRKVTISSSRDLNREQVKDLATRGEAIQRTAALDRVEVLNIDKQEMPLTGGSTCV